MPSGKKPRGLRVNKPQVPPIQIGDKIKYHEWRKKEPSWKFFGLAIAEPVWTDDGFWELDIYIPIAWANGGTGGHHKLVWDKKHGYWLSGEI